MATDKNTLKGWFVKGAKPLASQFAAWIDSFWHKDDQINISDINGLSSALSEKAPGSTLSAHTDDMSIHVTSTEKETWSAKQSELSAGTHISIVNNVVSVTGIDPVALQDGIASSGHTIEFSMSDDGNYVLTSSLKDANGNVLSTHSVNLPLEAAIVNAAYAEGVVTFTLQNGNTFTVDVTGIVSGLVNSSDFEEHTGNNGIHVTPTDKETWSAKQNALSASTNIDSEALQDGTIKTTEELTAKGIKDSNGNYLISMTGEHPYVQFSTYSGVFKTVQTPYGLISYIKGINDEDAVIIQNQTYITGPQYLFGPLFKDALRSALNIKQVVIFDGCNLQGDFSNNPIPIFKSLRTDTGHAYATTSGQVTLLNGPLSPYIAAEAVSINKVFLCMCAAANGTGITPAADANVTVRLDFYKVLQTSRTLIKSINVPITNPNKVKTWSDLSGNDDPVYGYIELTGENVISIPAKSLFGCEIVLETAIDGGKIYAASKVDIQISSVIQ